MANTVYFHWIHVHTNNRFHQQVDHIATRSLQQSTTYKLTLHQLLQNNTDATASGWAKTLSYYELRWP